MRERFSAGDATARLRFHTQTGGVTLQAQQPLNNVVRVTVQALAAVLGGTQSLHTNGYDEALALPTAESATLALRTQQMLGYESGVARGRRSARRQLLRRERSPTAIEAEARALIAGGGRARRARRARSSAGFFQEAIARSAYALQQAQESGERVVVGVNRFTDDSPPHTHSDARLLGARGAPARPAGRGASARGVRTAVHRRSGRPPGGCRRYRSPLMPPILDAVRARATLGEISDTLRDAWGVYRPA